MVRARLSLEDVDVDLVAEPEVPRRFLETPWPTAVRSGPARDARGAQGDLRAYTVGDWLMILLRLSTAGVLAGGIMGGLAAVIGAPLWLVLSVLG